MRSPNRIAAIHFGIAFGILIPACGSSQNDAVGTSAESAAGGNAGDPVASSDANAGSGGATAGEIAGHGGGTGGAAGGTGGAGGGAAGGRGGAMNAGGNNAVDAGGNVAGDGGHAPAGPSSGCGKTVPTGYQVLSIDVGGTKRSYLLTVPTEYAPSTPLPLYFAYHGRGGDHQQLTVYNIQDHVLGVFPDGLGGVWDTSLTGADVAMFDAVLASVEATTCVDQNRIYATGFSFGASMANTLGCARGNVLQAFSSVEGGILFKNSASDCKRPIAGWINQYKEDPTVSYATGEKAATFFLSLNADANPTPYDAPNPCVESMGKEPFVFCTPEGAMHTWPSYATAAMKRFFGSL